MVDLILFKAEKDVSELALVTKKVMANVKTRATVGKASTATMETMVSSASFKRNTKVQNPLRMQVEQQ